MLKLFQLPRRPLIGLALAGLLSPFYATAQSAERTVRANAATKVVPATAEACAALDDRDLRNRMDGLLFNLLWSCGRQHELTGTPETESFSEIVENLSDAVLAADIQVNNSSGESGSSSTQNETSIARSAVTGTLCSGFNDSYEYYGTGGGGGFTGFARSTNGGATWQDRGAVGATSLGDPSLIWRRRDGFFYLATLESGGALSIWRSTDDCFTFTKLSVPSTGNDDKEILAVDNNPASAHYGNIYMVWTDFGVTGTPIRAMRSTDGGVTWSAAVNLSAAGTVQGAWPAVAPNGTVYVAWLRYASWPSGNITVEVARSTNGGVSYTAVTSPLSNAVSPRASAASTTCGRPALNGNIRYLASPQITVTSDGALHVIYAYDPDGFNAGDVVNVYYRRSTDGGTTWGPQVQLNDVSTNDQYFGTIQSDGLRLVAGWYDRRNDASNIRQDYYKRVSTDAGVTWGPNVRVTDVNSPLNFDPGTASCYHGDYDQSVVIGSGEVMQWADDRNLVGTRNDADVWSDATSAVPDFSVSCSPASLTVQRGGSAATTCTVASSGGFSSAVSLSCASLPAGVTCTPSPNPVTPPANGNVNSSVTFAANSSATLGTVTVQVNGTSGATVRSANVSLTVTQPDFSVACSPASLTLPRNQSRTSTCTVTSTGGFSSAVALACSGVPSGVTCTPSPASVTPPANGSANSTVTFTASGSATLGTFGVTVSGTSGATVRNATITLTVNNPLAVAISSTYTAATCAASGGTPAYTYYWYVTPAFCDPCPGCCVLANGETDACCVANYTGQELPVPCPVRAPRPQNLCPEEGPYTTSPPNTWYWNGSEDTIRCTATDATSATVSSPSISRPAPDPDYTFTCSPTSLIVPPGQTRTTTCTVTSLYAFNRPVTLSCANLPAGVSCSPSPNPITPPAYGTASSTFSITAATSTALGTYTIQAVANDGVLPARSVNLSLNVSNPLVVNISADYLTATCAASGGTPGYTYYWYVTPTTCDPCPGCCLLANGQTDACCVANYTGQELPVPCPVRAPRPQNLCPEEGPYTTTPPNTWYWNGTEASLRCTAVDSVGASASSASISQPPPPPDFTLSCSPTSVTSAPGGSVATTCTVTSLYGFNSAVSLSCSGLPAGVTCTPSPNPVTPPAYGSASSSVTFAVSGGTALGTYALQVSGTGGGKTRSANVTLNVANAPLSATISVVSWTATCNAAGGTPPYTYRWYVRYVCDPCLLNNKEREARGEPALPCPIAAPETDTDALCPWEGPYTSSPANQWTLYGDEYGVRCNVTDAAGAVVNAYYYP